MAHLHPLFLRAGHLPELTTRAWRINRIVIRHRGIHKHARPLGLQPDLQSHPVKASLAGRDFARRFRVLKQSVGRYLSASIWRHCRRAINGLASFWPGVTRQPTSSRSFGWPKRNPASGHRAAFWVADRRSLIKYSRIRLIVRRAIQSPEPRDERQA
jgi:hypothetical protein